MRFSAALLCLMPIVVGIGFWILIVRPSIILSIYESIAKLVRLALSQL